MNLIERLRPLALPLLFALCMPIFPAHAAEPPHPCGAVAWMDEIRILQADFERERGSAFTRELLQATLTRMLPAVDAHLVVRRPGSANPNWLVRWEGSSNDTSTPFYAVLDNTDARDLYRGVLAQACLLLRQKDPEKAGRWLSGTWRSLWSVFEKAFIAQLDDPAAAFGFSDTALSTDSPSVKSANEWYSLQWLDRAFGIARLYLPDLYNYAAPPIDEELAQLRAQAPVKTLILDLRDAGGGSVQRLQTLLARFLPAGTLAYTLRKHEGQETEVPVNENTSPQADRQMRLIVLTSKKTRGGMELLAGALQANGRAVVIGEPTAGMAGYKRILKLSDDIFLLLTDALPRFPGQTQTVRRTTPNTAAAAQEALTIALATLAENGQQPENPFIRPDEHRFPLVQAVLERNTEEALRLIDAGAPLDVEASPEAMRRTMPYHFQPEAYGQTPAIGYPLAIAAAAQGMPKVLEAIGKRAPELLRRTDTDHRNALAYAALGGFVSSTRILLGHGLDPLHPARVHPISNTPLELATWLSHTDVVALLMAAIPRERLGHTAVLESVWIAAGRNDLATLKVLLEGGANPNYIAPQGGTALMDAVKYRRIDLVRLLLKHGATVDDHLYRGLNVLQYAEKEAANGDPVAREILELIRTAPRQDRGWKKSRDTEALEQLWKMIENPGKP